jgi:uncharacterized protein (DUF58 family)
LRRYEEGDDARHIDWITTAKSRTPFVKKYRETRELTTMILVDASRSMDFGSTKKAKKDIAIELTATILFSSLKNNDKFGAIIFDEEKVIFIPPKKGRTHLMRILKDVIRTYSETRVGSGDLSRALNAMIRSIKRSAICFLISDEIKEKDAKPLGLIGKKHDLVYFKINDPLELGEAPLGVFEMAGFDGALRETIDLSSEAVKGNYRLLRQDKIDQELKIIKERRIDHLLISTEANIYKELILFFKKRQRRA